MPTAQAEPAPRAVGRPPRLSREAILEAAMALGADEVTMSAVAERLGVSIGALYRHVPSRSELLRLVADAQLRSGTPPRDVGQHWASLARGYAEMLFLSFVQRPSLILEYANGSFPPEFEVDQLEGWLEAMGRRAFSPIEALGLIRDIRAAAMGAAIAATAAESIAARVGVETALAAAFAGRDNAELPLLRSIGAEYRDYVGAPGWQEVVDRLLAAVAAERGEVLPDGWREGSSGAP